MFACLMLAFSCAKSDDTYIDVADETENEAALNIIEFTNSVEELSLFAELLQANGSLSSLLTSGEEFTVFAPTNSAINAILLEIENNPALANNFDFVDGEIVLEDLLKYHIVPGDVNIQTVFASQNAMKTLLLEELILIVNDSVTIIDKTGIHAEVVDINNELINGRVHIVNKVLLAEQFLEEQMPAPSIAEAISDHEDLSLFMEALQRVGLSEQLKDDGPYTIFAPSDEAIEGLFNQLGEEFADFNDFDTAMELLVLRDLLFYHIVPRDLPTADFQVGVVSTLLQDESIEIQTTSNSFIINDATEVSAGFVEIDREGSNGTLHIIDKVLIPRFIIDVLGETDF